jgi:hypothetical protein
MSTGGAHRHGHYKAPCVGVAVGAEGGPCWLALMHAMLPWEEAVARAGGSAQGSPEG